MKNLERKKNIEELEKEEQKLPDYIRKTKTFFKKNN